MTKTVALLIVLGVGAGCSSGSGGWTKPDTTEEQANRDSADCLFESATVVPGREGPRRVVDQDRYRQCMSNRGYTAGPTK